jgi:hypothetical protein
MRGHLVDEVRSVPIRIVLDDSWEGGTVTAVDIECWGVLLYGFLMEWRVGWFGWWSDVATP